MCDHGVRDAGFGDVLERAVEEVAVGFDETEAETLFGVLLHTVFHERALAGAALAEDIYAVVAVGFGEHDRCAEVNGGVRLTAEVEHSGEGAMGSL